MVFIRNEICSPNSNPGQDCVSLHANALWKGINPFLLLKVMGK